MTKNTTLVAGLAVLEYLIDKGRPISLSQIAQDLGISKSTTHRILQTLVDLGYIAQRSTRQYAMTLKTWELGARTVNRLDFRTRASSVMRDLQRRTNATIHLSVLSGEDVIYIDKLDGATPVGGYSVIGGRAPAYCVATGKALLAWHERTLTDLLNVRPLHRFTKTTISDTAQLAMELHKIKKQGYALNKGEWREAIWGVAAPIFGGIDGRAVAAIGISGPARQIKQTAPKELGLVLRDAALTISGPGAPSPF